MIEAKKLNYTPGPWGYDSVDTPFQLVNGECIGGEDSGVRDVFANEGMLNIATIYPCCGVDHTANTCLIAAAPDMYELLCTLRHIPEVSALLDKMEGGDA